jgi:copper chaperone CopZ
MKYELQIEGMTCLNCAKTLEHALASVPGVERAEVSYGRKHGTVVADDRVRPETLRETVAHAGYRASVVGHDTNPTIAPDVAASEVATQSHGADYDLECEKLHPMIASVVRSTRSRRAAWRSTRSRHCAAPLAVTSMRLSTPKPTSATLPAIRPATRDTTASSVS